MKLYTYFRSSATYRVRIALHLKGLDAQQVPVHLRRDGGEHHRPEYLALNPQGLVPALEHEGHTLAQSLAIIEYLDELAPEPRLLPEDPAQRAQVRSMALAIACDLHPLNNLRVLEYLRGPFGHGEEEVHAWYRHWVAESFRGLEEQARVTTGDGRYLFGAGVTLADLCLVPQVSNARRFECDLEPYPTLRAIAAHLESLPAFSAAAPERQLDARAAGN